MADPVKILRRVQADLRAEGIDLHFEVHPYGHRGWRLSAPGGAVATREPLSAGLLASLVQDLLFDNTIDSVWPMCPAHGHHPLNARGDRWVCPTDERRTWVIGRLAG